MRAILLALLCATAVPARAETAARPSPAAIVAAMPGELPFWRREGGVLDYEARPGGAGFGASVRYTGIRGMKAIGTVYVYDHGTVQQPEGGTAAGVAAELESAVAEIRAIAATGRYSLLAEPVPMAAGPASGPGSARCLLVPLRQPDGETTRDAVCVTIHQRRFLKTRVTLFNDPDPRRASVIAFVMMAETSPGFLPAGPKR